MDKNSVLEGSRRRWIVEKIFLEGSRMRWIDKNSVPESSRRLWIEKNSDSKGSRNAQDAPGHAGRAQTLRL